MIRAGWFALISGYGIGYVTVTCGDLCAWVPFISSFEHTRVGALCAIAHNGYL